jgi:hypothetical protein
VTGLVAGTALNIAEQFAVAGVPLRVPVQSVVLPCMKAIVPVGKIAGLTTPAGVAVAAKFTSWLTTDVCAVGTIAILALIGLTVCGSKIAVLVA